MTQQTTLSWERRRAAYVARAIQEWDVGWRREAVQCARGLPAALRSQGLLVTVARLVARDRSAETRLADLVARWLLQDAPVRWLTMPSGGRRPTERLLAACRRADRVSYRRAQGEALALLDLVKLLADAFDAFWAAGGGTVVPILAEATASPEPPLPKRRLSFTFDNVASWNEGILKVAATRAKGLPVEVRTEGLLVALANLVRSGSPGQRVLAELTARWLLDAAPRKPLAVADDVTADSKTLLQACGTAGRTEYRAAEAEALALLGNLKVYTSGMTQGSDNGD